MYILLVQDQIICNLLGPTFKASSNIHADQSYSIRSPCCHASQLSWSRSAKTLVMLLSRWGIWTKAILVRSSWCLKCCGAPNNQPPDLDGFQSHPLLASRWRWLMFSTLRKVMTPLRLISIINPPVSSLVHVSQPSSSLSMVDLLQPITNPTGHPPTRRRPPSPRAPSRSGAPALEARQGHAACGGEPWPTWRASWPLNCVSHGLSLDFSVLDMFMRMNLRYFKIIWDEVWSPSMGPANAK